MSTQAAQKQVPIQDFVSQLRKFPEPAFDSHRPKLSRFLRRTAVAPDTLAPYLNWDRQHYTRNLIDKTPLYELIAICWEVGQASSVHNHRDQNCWMAVPIGRLLVENFHVVSQEIEQGRCQLETADTVEMNPATLARSIRRNPCTACSIHANSTSAPSACTSTRDLLTPASSTHRSKAPAEKSNCTTPRNSVQPKELNRLSSARCECLALDPC